MISRRRSIFFLVFFIALAVMLIVLVRYYLLSQKTVIEINREVENQAFVLAAQEVQRRFENGDLEGHYQSGNFNCQPMVTNGANIHDQYFRCNPLYIHCWLSGHIKNLDSEIKIKVANQNFQFTANDLFKSNLFNRPLKYQTLLAEKSELKYSSMPAYIFELQDKNRPEKSFRFALQDTCRMTYLPQRIYGSVLNKRFNDSEFLDWRWDNFNRFIFIDRFLVSNKDVWEWSEAALLNKKIEPNTLHITARNLSKSQMQQYCASRGAQLLDAHLFDAASIYPGDIENSKPLKIAYHPYSWVQKKKINPILDCDRMYSKECAEKKSFIYFNPASVSWIGLSEVMGGYFQALRNPIESNYNLALTSKYLSFKSQFQKLGRRTTWDGEQNLGENIEMDMDQDELQIETTKEYHIGFRCFTSY